MCGTQRTWIPAFAGMTGEHVERRGSKWNDGGVRNDGAGCARNVGAGCARMTEWSARELRSGVCVAWRLLVMLFPPRQWNPSNRSTMPSIQNCRYLLRFFVVWFRRFVVSSPRYSLPRRLVVSSLCYSSHPRCTPSRKYTTRYRALCALAHGIA